MSITEILFIGSFAILFYCYAGYGIILFAWNWLKPGSGKPAMDPQEWMPVALVVTAFNEGNILEEKIHNTLELDYPADKLEIIFVTDGSTDGSMEIVSKFPRIQLLHQPERRGKLAAIKRAMLLVQTPVVVFSDANTFLNKECVKRIVMHYNDPQTGGVAGEKRIKEGKKVSAVGEAEGIYWRYESFMKNQDAQFYTVVGAAGELFSIRTALFRQPDETIILDDFFISMQVCLQGYTIRYEPGAYAIESPSASLAEEEKRKIRISAGAYQSVGYLKECLNFFKHPLLAFQYLSRRLLRWIICPPLLFILLLSNILLALRHPHNMFYTGFLLAQLLFYLMVIPGWLLVRAGKKAGWLAVPFYFVFMNYCLVKGFIRFIRGKQTVLWEKSLRQAVE